MTPRELQRLARARRYQDGDCVVCGLEPRGAGVLCESCRERNNARRRSGGARRPTEGPGMVSGRTQSKESSVKMLAEWFWIERWEGSSAAMLPMEAQGIYRAMLSHAWRRGASLPTDEEEIQLLIRCRAKEWARSWPLVKPYWKVEGGVLVNETQQEVYREALGRKERAQARAQAGAQASAQARAQAQSKDKHKDSLKQSPPITNHQSPTPSPSPTVDPGRVVKAESTATPDGTPLSNPSGVEPTATAPRRLTPQALGIKTDPGNFAQVQLAHDLTALVEVYLRSIEANGEDPRALLFGDVARDLLHDISVTLAGKRIETLDLRRVSAEWATVSSHAAYKLAAEVYGVDLANVDPNARVPEPTAPAETGPALKRPDLTLTVAPGSCPVCSSLLRHVTEGGETVLRCTQEIAPCEWAAVWKSCAA